VFMEMSRFQCYYGLVHHVGSPPVIGIRSVGITAATLAAVGNPNNLAYFPDSYLSYTSHMTFFERLHNTAFYIWNRYIIVLQQSHGCQVRHPGTSFKVSVRLCVPHIKHNVGSVSLQKLWNIIYIVQMSKSIRNVSSCTKIPNIICLFVGSLSAAINNQIGLILWIRAHFFQAGPAYQNSRHF
jgi:hypothetical protein